MSLPSLLDALERLPAFARVLNTLPAPSRQLNVAGLPGSADAALVAALARRLPTRFLVIAADGVPQAERLLADLHTLLDETPVALYPPREGFGEAEPHVEVAGERVETLERLSRGEIRVLLTTPRALLERTRLPGALADLRIELRKGDTHRPRELAEHLERIGFERVPMVEDVSQFSLRGGIFDVYSFGMTDPVRMEFWGDTIEDLRHFELSSQRSTRAVDLAVVLPVDGQLKAEAAQGERLSISALFPPDTLFVYPVGSHLLPELKRTWDEAAHHLDLARRRGEDVDSREELFESPECTAATLHAFGSLRLVDPAAEDAEVVFPLRAPEPIDRDIKRLRRLVRDGLPTVILCDNEGQAERLDELLNEDTRDPSPAALVVGALGGGWVLPPGDHERGMRVLTDHEIFRRERRVRRARRYVSGGVDSLALKLGDYVVHLEHGVGIYRGIETIFVGQSTIEVAVVEYEGGDRLNVPLYRIDQLERYRSADDINDDAPPPRLHKLGGKRWAQQRDRTRAAIQEMTLELLDLYARRKVAARPPHVPDTAWQRQLERSFLFEDTPDQRKATTDVKKDLESTRP
ncbi:MAG: transcription-repair coupling factor, partial [Gemmatimonadetes bacterium]|nr:transcription-repair coupling factor [Gemmatimonadota bacterium]